MHNVHFNFASIPRKITTNSITFCMKFKSISLILFVMTRRANRNDVTSVQRLLHGDKCRDEQRREKKKIFQ